MCTETAGREVVCMSVEFYFHQRTFFKKKKKTPFHFPPSGEGCAFASFLLLGEQADKICPAPRLGCFHPCWLPETGTDHLLDIQHCDHDLKGDLFPDHQPLLC